MRLLTTKLILDTNNAMSTLSCDHHPIQIRPHTSTLRKRTCLMHSSVSRRKTFDKWKEFGSALYDKVSLNDAARRREQTMISEQNDKLRERIRRGEIQSLYSRDTMAKLESERQKYIRNISKASRRRLHTSTGTRESIRSLPNCISKLPSRPQTAPLPHSETWNQLDKPSITTSNGSAFTSQTARTIRKEALLHNGKPLPSYFLFSASQPQ